MNREIKFRAWHKANKRMMYRNVFDRNWYTESRAGKCIDGIHPSDVNAVELMQYTGLKDKNGVEIYEGDIVKAFTVYGMTYDYCFEKDNDPENIYQICFDDGCFQFKNTKQWSDGSNDWKSIENVELFKVEVIGNIYENPELINGDV